MQRRYAPRGPPCQDLSYLNNFLAVRFDTELNAIIPLAEFLYSDEFENYCKDPFYKSNEEQFMIMLEVP